MVDNRVPQHSRAVSAHVERCLTWLFEHGVLIPHPTQVRQYLVQHADVASILQSTCQLALDRLNIQSQLSLEVSGDREIEEEYLTLYVRQTHYTADILRRIEAVQAAYAADLIDRSGWFLFTTDFQPPL